MRPLAEIIADPEVGKALTDTPRALIDAARERFVAVAPEADVWQELCESPFLLQDMDDDVQVIRHRYGIATAVSRVLMGEDEMTWRMRFAWCKTPGDYRRFFLSLGVPGDKWREAQWMIRDAQEPPPVGLGYSLSAFTSIVSRKDAWGSYRYFVAWMDGRDMPAFEEEQALIPTMETPKEFREFFDSRDIPERVWRNTGLFTKHTMPIEGGRSCNCIIDLIRTRFGGHPNFTAWMDGKERALTMPERIAQCTKPEHFLALFVELGIPGEQWRNSEWLGAVAGLPPEEGGIGKSLSSLYSRLTEDERWDGFRGFVAWMDGKEEARPTYVQGVKDAEDPEQMLAYIQTLGIDPAMHPKWMTHKWLNTTSKLPAEKGGIGKGMSGLEQAIRKNPRFKKSLRTFQGWMKKDPVGALTLEKQIELCTGTQHFLDLFARHGIPGDNWKSFTWMVNKARKPVEEGGVGKSFAGLAYLLCASPRWGKSYPGFVAWMEGKMGPELTPEARVAACTDRPQFLELFAMLEVPGDAWRSGSFLHKHSKKSPEEGGLGRSLWPYYRAIKADPRFKGSYEFFVAWMEGIPLEGIASREQAGMLLEQQAIRLGVTTKDLLDPHRAKEYMKHSPALRLIYDYFSTAA